MPRITAIVVAFLLASAPAFAGEVCESTSDPTLANLVALSQMVEATRNVSTMSTQNVNALVAWRTVRSLHMDQLGFTDESQVRVASQVPEANTPDVWRIMPADSMSRLAGVGAFTHPSQVPKQDREGALLARGFQPARDFKGAWTIGKPWPGERGQLIAYSPGSPTARLITYDGTTVTYTVLGLYEYDTDTRATRWEVKDRVVIQLPEKLPKRMTHF